MIARRITALLCTVPLALPLALVNPAQAQAATAKTNCHHATSTFVSGLNGVGEAAAVGAAIGVASALVSHWLPSKDCPAAPADDTVKLVVKAEKAVAKSPRNAVLRADLGRAYLKDGRVQSAMTSLSDAVTLGDNSNRTLLALALTQIANGQNREAMATLDQGRNVIPAADLGLAFALAGEPSRGTTILGDALRAGDKSDKLRANLAYAYALDGRWAEARNLVALDLPADKVDERMTEWAKIATPEASRERVASLLGVAIKADGGLPTRLALAPVAGDAPKLASAESAPVNAPALAAGPAAELPALAAESAPPVVDAAPAPVQFAAVEPVGAAAPVVAETAPGPVAPKFHAVAVKGAASHKLAMRHGKAKGAKPVHEAKPFDSAPAQAPVEPVEKSAEPILAEAAGGAKAAGGGHIVQLGAFLNEKNAQRAKKQTLSRDKSLAEGDVTVAKAVVSGKTFWRVTVAGLDAAAAASKCQSIRKAGGACFARIEGAVSGGAKMAVKKASKALAMATPAKHH